MCEGGGGGYMFRGGGGRPGGVVGNRSGGWAGLAGRWGWVVLMTDRSPLVYRPSEVRVGCRSRVGRLTLRVGDCVG